ncbi:MAG: hypothetical protein R2838_08125 [Caldilineaceae bacterium]
MDIFVAVRLTLALVYGLSAWAMIAFLRPLPCLGPRPWPPPSSFSSSLSPARPLRAALPEFAAFLWLPLVAWGLTVLLRHLAARTSWRPKLRLSTPTLVFAALTVAGAGAHPQPVRGWWVAAGAMVPLLAFTPDARSRVGGGVLALGLAFRAGRAPWLRGTSCPRWWRRVGGIGSTPLPDGFANHFVDWRNAVNWGLPYVYPAAADATVPLPGYAIVALVFGVAALG